MKFLTTDNKGFSAIELLIACGILCLLTAAGFISIDSSQKTLGDNLSIVKTQSSLRTALDVLKRDLKEAKRGVDPAGAGCDDENPNGVCIHTSPVELAFKVPESTNNSQTSYKTIKYAYNSVTSTLTRFEIPSSGPPASNTSVIGKNISSASFSQSTSSYVNATLSSDNQSNTLRIALRNKP